MAQPASLSFPRRGRPGFEDLSRRQACAAPGLLRGQLLQSGQGQPRGTHPDPVVSMGDPGHHPCGVGDKQEWPTAALHRPISTALARRLGPRGHWAHGSGHQTRYSRSGGEAAKAPSGVGARQRAGVGGLGLQRAFMWSRSKTLSPPLPPSLLPAILVSGLLPQPLLLPGKALRPPCPPDSQVSPSAWCPAKPSPTHSLRSGFDCIAYPLWSPRSGDLEPRAALESARDPLFHMGDLETALASDASRGQRDVPSGLPGEWSYPTWWW